MLLEIRAQYLKEAKFENPDSPFSLNNSGSAPDVDINLNVESKKFGDLSYEILLSASTKATRLVEVTEGLKESQIVFSLEVTYGAVAFINKDTPESEIEPLLMVEGPTLLFPFLRRIVANLTIDGGFPPLMINPVDFHEMYLNNKKNNT